ncbi:MAG: hypothetical protein ABI775_07580 [Pseudonocardiales bacterium]|nr:hypothetical protein [Actinomycetota bacterium]
MTTSPSSARHASVRGLRTAGLITAVTVSGGVSGALIAGGFRSVSGNRMAPWMIGRAAGITSYLLLVMLVLLGLALSHPWRTRLTRSSPAARIRLHVALTVFALAFTLLHVVVLATDRYAAVGWWGALLPMRSSYRPAAVTLGIIGLWSGFLSGVTATLAGHLPRRAWWPIHKVAMIALVLVWLHGVLAGGDTSALRWFYVSTGLLVLAVAVSRYAARTPSDELEALR